MKVLRVKSVNGDTSFQNETVQVNKVGAKLRITTEITGYTLAYIYGSGGTSNLKRLKYREIVVPTYKIELYDSDKKFIKNYDVTRDSWYYRGFKDEKPDWSPFPPYDSCKLVNRHFNPPNNHKNLYNAIARRSYPCEGLEAFALYQNGKGKIPAECHTKEQNTYLDGSSVEGARKDLCVAYDVMIHIGGWYYNSNVNKNGLAGSEGCFGFIPKHQIFNDKDELQDILKNKMYTTWEISNSDYLKFISDIVKIKGNIKNLVHIVVEQRQNVEIFKDADYD